VGARVRFGRGGCTLSGHDQRVGGLGLDRSAVRAEQTRMGKCKTTDKENVHASVLVAFLDPLGRVGQRRSPSRALHVAIVFPFPLFFRCSLVSFFSWKTMEVGFSCTMAHAPHISPPRLQHGSPPLPLAHSLPPHNPPPNKGNATPHGVPNRAVAAFKSNGSPSAPAATDQ